MRVSVFDANMIQLTTWADVHNGRVEFATPILRSGLATFYVVQHGCGSLCLGRLDHSIQVHRANSPVTMDLDHSCAS